MTPVDQTRFNSKELGTRGNCLSACLATILDRSIDNVCDFSKCSTSSEQLLILDRWLEPLGLVTSVDCKGSKFDGFRIACGITQRGIYHSVIYLNETLAHDPHPSRDGLNEVAYYIHVIKNKYFTGFVDENFKSIEI